MKHRRFRKPYRVRRKKSILRNRFFWLTLMFISIIGGFFYLIAFSKTFEISEIQISGNQKIQKTDLENIIKEKINRKLLAFIPANNLLFLNLTQMKEEISKKFPLITDISLDRGFPDKLFLDIKERQPYGIWCQNEEPCFYLDQEGIIFDPVRSNISNVVEEISKVGSRSVIIKDFTKEDKIQLGEQAIEKSILELSYNIKKNLKVSFKIDAENFDLLSAERLNVKTTENWEIYFNLNGDTDWQITKLTSVLEEEISPENRGDLEYIDLRFSRVYYKYR